MKGLNFCTVCLVISFVILTSQTYADKPTFYSTCNYPVSPNRFQVEIEVNDEIHNKTFLIKEYHEQLDGKLKLSVIISETPFSTIHVIYDEIQKSPEITIQDFACVSSSSFNDDGFMIVNNMPVFLLTTLYQILPNLVMRTEPVNVEEMIPADAYDGLLQNLNSSDMQYSAEVYFKASSSQWQFPHCLFGYCQNLPVKAIIRGNSTITGSFAYQLTFFNFPENNIDVTDFQVPVGVYCGEWRNNLPVPKIATDFTSGMEMYFPEAKASFKSKVFFSNTLKSLRIDSIIDKKISSSTIPFKGSTGIEISDFVGGVQYTFDFNDDSCLKVQNLTLDEMKNGLNKVIAFLTADNKDEVFYYVGKREIRTLECDVWVKQEKDETILELYLQKYQYVFPDGHEQEQFIPIFINESIVLNNQEITVVETFFYNFYINAPEVGDFDFPDDCVMTSFKKTFQLEFVETRIGSIERVKNESNVFLLLVRTEITKLLGISHFRLQDLQVKFSMKNAKKETIIVTANFVEDLKILVSFSGFSTIKSNDELYNTLEYLISRDEMKVMLPLLPDGSIPVPDMYPAVGINDNVVPTFVPLNSSALMNMYRPFSHKMLFKNYDFEIQHLTIYDCLEQCTNEKRFVCQSASYCASQEGVCRISREHIRDKYSENLKEAIKCDTYSRFYSYDYTKFLRKRLLWSSIEEESAKETLKSSEECAYSCSQNLPDLYYCEGFNACVQPDNTVLCEYRSTHVLEAEDRLVQKENCDAYSRDYLEDFLRHPNKTIVHTSNIALSSADNPDNCARLCITSAQAVDCVAFEMCRIDETMTKELQCNLLIQGDGDSFTTTNSSSCDFYERVHDLPAKHQTLDPAHRKTPQPTKGTAFTTHLIENETVTSTSEVLQKSIHTGYGAGDMGGLAAGMLVLGLLLGCMITTTVLCFKLIKI